jgi:hypothetical protein
MERLETSVNLNLFEDIDDFIDEVDENKEVVFPVRNLDCPHYEHCLLKAAILNKETFSCEGCEHINEGGLK